MHKSSISFAVDDDMSTAAVHVHETLLYEGLSTGLWNI